MECERCEVQSIGNGWQIRRGKVVKDDLTKITDRWLTTEWGSSVTNKESNLPEAVEFNYKPESLKCAKQK